MALATELSTAVIGLGAGAGLAALKYTLTQRARMHEDLWSRRLDPYRDIWALSSQFSRWPRQHPTIADIERLHERLRQWYYGDGGILMSQRSRASYEYVQKGLGAICAAAADPREPVSDGDYADMVVIFSRFRTALANDLESRRKRSIIWSMIEMYEARKIRRQLKQRLDGRSRRHGVDA